MKKITLDELLRGFDPSVREQIKELAEDPDTTHLVVFENVNLSSAHLGDKSCLAVGPGRTYTIESVEGEHLFDLPSQRQYPWAYWEK